MFYRSLMAVAALSFSTLAFSQSFFDKISQQKPANLSYKYISVEYVDYGDFGDGFGFTGSFEIKKNIAANIYYDTVSEGDLDLTALGIDALIYQPLQDAKDTDVFYGIGFRRLEADGNGFDASESGLVFTAGVRKEIDPDLEINGKVAFETVDDNDLEFGVGAVYEISDLLHFQASLLFLDDEDRLGLGVRYYID